MHQRFSFSTQNAVFVLFFIVFTSKRVHFDKPAWRWYNTSVHVGLYPLGQATLQTLSVLVAPGAFLFLLSCCRFCNGWKNVQNLHIALLLQILHCPIKVRHDLLRRIEQVILSFCLFSGLPGRYLALVWQDVIPPEGQKLVDAGGKLFHGEGIFPFDQVLDIVKIARYGTLQLADLFFGQVVFCHRHARFEHFSPMWSLVWSALLYTISAAVWPVIA